MKTLYFFQMPLQFFFSQVIQSSMLRLSKYNIEGNTSTNWTTVYFLDLFLLHWEERLWTDDTDNINFNSL